MKIIKHGVVPAPVISWPIGRTFQCGHCGCRFEIEKGDAYYISTERQVDDERHVPVL